MNSAGVFLKDQSISILLSGISQSIIYVIDFLTGINKALFIPET